MDQTANTQAEAIKKSMLAEQEQKQRNILLSKLNSLGDPAHMFRIIDEREMTLEMIEEYEDFFLAIKSGVPGRPPKLKPVYGRPTVGDKYEIRWRYDLREGVSGPKILPDGRTRAFCQDVLAAGRFYTRADIDRLSNGFPELDSVFRYAGGWWTQPDGIVSPKCRHTWKQMFVEKIK